MVILKRLHRRFEPRFVIFMPIPHDRRNRIMPIGKNIGLNDDALAGNSLDWKSAAFKFRLNSLNDHALRRADRSYQKRITAGKVF